MEGKERNDRENSQPGNAPQRLSAREAQDARALLDAEERALLGRRISDLGLSIRGTSVERFVERHRIPVVIAGFEPLDILAGLVRTSPGIVPITGKGEAKFQPLAIETVKTKAARNRLTNIETVLVDSYNSGIADSVADIVLLIDMIHGIEDRAALFHEVHRLLKPAGLLFVDAEHTSAYEVRSQLGTSLDILIDGGALPARVLASPLLSQDNLLAVLENATFQAFNPREQALLDELREHRIGRKRLRCRFRLPPADRREREQEGDRGGHPARQDQRRRSRGHRDGHGVLREA